MHILSFINFIIIFFITYCY